MTAVLLKLNQLLSSSKQQPATDKQVFRTETNLMKSLNLLSLLPRATLKMTQVITASIN